MVCFTLLFIVTFAVGRVTSVPCSYQPPPGPASGDDFPGSQEVTALEYCFINNCTIMITDTGEKLDIVYTADSLLVATPTDGRTAVKIAKLDNELVCITSNTVNSTPAEVYIVMLLFTTLVLTVNGCVIVVHLMFKQLRTSFGKLLMLYCLYIVCMAVSFFVRMTMVLSQTGRLLLACHYLTLIVVTFSIGYEATATSMLHCLTYIVYRSNQLQRITQEESKSLYRWHIGYILGTMFLVAFLMITYDVGVHRGAHILPNGECTTSDPLNTAVLSINGGVQKSIQVVMFAFYLYYKYQLNKDVQNPDILHSQEKLLHRIAVAMGGTIGMSLVLYIIYTIFLFTPAFAMSWALFFIQQCMITVNLLFTKKMKGMCKEYFLKD